MKTVVVVGKKTIMKKSTHIGDAKDFLIMGYHMAQQILFSMGNRYGFYNDKVIF